MGKGIATLALVAVLMAIVGCGDGGDDSGATTATAGGPTAATAPTLSRAAYIRKADQICNEDSRALPVKLATYEQRARRSGRPEEEVFKEFVDDVLLPTLETRLDKLAALGMPSDGEQKLQAFLRAMERGVTVARQSSATTFAALEKPFQPAIKIGQAFGFVGCAR